MDPVYGYEAVNVEAQSRSLSSLLSATKRLISVRKSTLAFGRGTMTFIRPANRSALAYIRQYRDEAILCVANLSRSAQATELDLSAWKDRVPLEMLGRTRFPAIGELPYMITLAPYGFYWFKLQEREKSEHAAPSIAPEFETLVVPLGATWVSLARTRSVFERDVLPGFLARSRWYPERSPKAIHPVLISAMPFCDIGDNKPSLALFEATQHGSKARYVLPMRIGWVRFDRERYNPCAFAIVHAFVENQGDAWSVTSAYLDRFVDEQRLLQASEHPGESEEQVPYLRYMSQIGKRVAEMHLALAGDSESEVFAPEAIAPEDVQCWSQDLSARAERVFEALQQRRDTFKDPDRLMVQKLLEQRHTLPGRLSALLPQRID